MSAGKIEIYRERFYKCSCIPIASAQNIKVMLALKNRIFRRHSANWTMSVWVSTRGVHTLKIEKGFLDKRIGLDEEKYFQNTGFNPGFRILHEVLSIKWEVNIPQLAEKSQTNHITKVHDKTNGRLRRQKKIRSYPRNHINKKTTDSPIPSTINRQPSTVNRQPSTVWNECRRW